MAEITEETIYRVNLDIKELNRLNNDEPLHLVIDGRQIIIGVE